MKFLSLLLLLAAAMLAGCSTTANNTGNASNANIRGTNTNTGYVTNSDTTVKPTIPPNATNLTPGNMSGNNNSNSNTNRTNRNMNK